MTTLRIATRTSALAVAQATMVARRLQEAHPDIEPELVGIETTGDLDQASPVAALTEMGAFVRSVQVAVLDGRADLAVHSCKDLPTSSPLDIAAFPERANPFDVLVGTSWDNLEPAAVLGTGSPRRVAQLQDLRDDFSFVELRGNVDTRIAKIARGEAHAAVLAHAGLSRLGKDAAIASTFSLDQMVPAPAQGIIAVEAKPDTSAHELARSIDDAQVRTQAQAERGLLQATGAGCRSSLAAYAELRPDGLQFTVFVSDERGPRRESIEAASPELAIAEIRRLLSI